MISRTFMAARAPYHRVLALTAVFAVLVVACSPGTPRTGSATEAPFDQRFIDMMVPHHQGAIAMAQIAQQRAQRPEIKQMAEEVIRAQDGEIRQMKQWRQSWYDQDQPAPQRAGH